MGGAWLPELPGRGDRLLGSNHRRGIDPGAPGDSRSPWVVRLRGGSWPAFAFVGKKWHHFRNNRQVSAIYMFMIVVVSVEVYCDNERKMHHEERKNSET